MLHKSQLNRNLLSYFFFQVVELVYSSIFYKFLFFLMVFLFKCFCRHNIDSVYIGNCTWDGKRCLGKFVCLASWIEILFRRSAMRFNIRTWCSHCGKFHSHIFQIKTTAWRIFFSDINYSKHWILKPYQQIIFSRNDLPINTRSMNVLCGLSATKEC